MVNAADRTGPNYDVLPDAVEDASPQFPFRISHEAGYFESITLAVGESFEITYRSDRDYNDEYDAQEGTWTNYFIWCAALAGGPILIGPVSMSYWADPQDTASDSSGVGYGNVRQEGKTYRLRLTYADVNTLETRLWEEGNGGIVSSRDLVVTDLFDDGNPVFYIGALPDSLRALITDTSRGFYASPCYGLIIMKAPDAGNQGPTDLAIDNDTIAAGDTDVGAFVGNFSATHATESDGFGYNLVAGSGDTDNASYYIEAGKLYTAAVLTAGADSIRVEVTDKYGFTYAKAVTITIS